ncbi:MAG: class I SAM-dependent methyltransferase [Proteobacteria bacterium]|nr:class I SAM-dependent methyltransferase [Pseudomonadota bacterium]
MPLASLKAFIRASKDRRIRRLPSRIFLETVAIPALAKAGRQRMLFVGTRSYNRPAYERCKTEGIAAWSIDMDAAAAAYGAPDGHLIGNVCDIEALAGGQRFDVIIFNGVLGWGLNNAPEALLAVKAMKNVVAPGGLLFVGWNPGLTDGAEIAIMRPHLVHTSVGAVPEDIEFPPRGAAQRYPHRYELFTFA